MSFLCPCCHLRLNVPTELAGIAGPCPACAQIIRAPKAAPNSPVVNSEIQVSTSEFVSPGADPVEESRGFTKIDPREGGVGLSELRKIPATQEDDSWREEVERKRKLSRKRRRRSRRLEEFLCSRKAERLQKIALLLIAGILVVTMAVIYLNHRSGGALMKKWLG